MFNPDLFDFMIEGGDELLNSEECPHCNHIIYLDGDIKWLDKQQKICKCPQCGKKTRTKYVAEGFCLE